MSRARRILGFIGVGAALAILVSVVGSLVIHRTLQDRAERECRVWLSAVAEGRRQAVEDWLVAGLRDVALVAGHGETLRVASGDGSVERLEELLDATVSAHGYRHARVITGNNRVLAASARSAGRHSGKNLLAVDDAGEQPPVKMVADPVAGHVVVFSAPVEGSVQGGVVEIYDHSARELASAVASTDGSPHEIEARLVHRVAGVWQSLGASSEVRPTREPVIALVESALEREGTAFAALGLNGEADRFAAAIRVAETGWWLVTTVSRERVLAAAAHEARLLSWLVTVAMALLLAIAVGYWRHQRALRYRELAGSEARYRALFESAPVSLWEEDLSGLMAGLDELAQRGVTDLDGYLRERPDELYRLVSMIRVVAVNKATLELYGAASLEELVEVLPTLFTGEADAVFRAELVAFARGERRVVTEVASRTLSGEPRTVHVHVSVPPGPHGFSKALVAVVDLTEEEAARQRLRESELKYRLLFDASTDGVFIHDFEGRMLDVNEGACRQVGRTRAELLGATPQLFTAPHRAGAVIERLQQMRSEGAVLFDAVHVAAGGRQVPVEISSTEIEYEGKPAVLSVARDVTERRAALERITFLNTLLRTRSAVDRLTITERDRRRLLDGVCSILVEEGEFALAWFVAGDATAVGLEVAAASQTDSPFLAVVREAVEGPGGARTPCGETMRSGTPTVINELLGETGDSLGLRQAAVQLGYRSMAAFRVRAADKVFGTVALCSEDPGMFMDEVVALLREIASDLAFALDGIETRAALARSEEQFRVLAEHAQDIVFRFRLRNPRIFEYVSPAAERVLGYRAEQLEADPRLPLRALYREDRRKMLEATRGEVPPGKVVVLRWHHRDGKTVWTEQLSTVLRDERGRPEVLVGVARDISERRRMEEQIQRTTERLEEAQRLARVGNWEWDLDAGVSYWSDEVYRMAGLDPAGYDQPVGDPLDSVHPEDRERVRRAERAALAGEAEYAVEYRLVCPDGRERTVFDRGEVVRDVQGKPVRVFGTVQDVTDQRKLEGQLRQAQKMEAIGRLAGGVAHDFNNILQAMMMFGERLRLTAGDAETTVRVSEELDEQLGRAAALTRQLLLFSRRETTRPETLEFSDVVSGMARMLRRLVRENIDFSVRGTGEPVPVQADRGQLGQVVMNLVVNAADAMPDGGRLEVRVGRQIGTPGWAVLEVQDTGHGIPDKVREHIFDPFFTTKEREHGTGLGLAVVHGIVTDHGGRIEIDSQVGVGTTFSVLLPLADSTGDGVAPTETSGALQRGCGEHVLVVEDHPAVRSSLVSTLQALGYRVTALESGEEALACAESPDVLLSDQVLPGINGLDLAERLRASRPDLPVVLMSGYSDDARLQEKVRSGAIRFLRKPTGLASLAREIKAALEDEARGEE